MASADWTEVTDSLSAASLARGVTSGVTPPSGGGSFVYAYNSLDSASGVAALLINLANFNPTAKGARISGALQRAVGGGNLGFAPFIFAGLAGPAVTDIAYMLGLADGDPAHIVLRKGTLATGLPDSAPGSNGILRRSDATFSLGTWLHLRLDMIVNLNGDVILRCWKNDLAANPVTTPVWEAINGMADFVDDPCQINSGSAPILAGRLGFGSWKNAIGRRMYVDHIYPQRQT